MVDAILSREALAEMKNMVASVERDDNISAYVIHTQEGKAQEVAQLLPHNVGRISNPQEISIDYHDLECISACNLKNYLTQKAMQ